MRVSTGFLLASLALVAASGCSSQPIDDAAEGGGRNGASSSAGGKSGGGSGGGLHAPTPCSGALRQAVTLVESVSSGAVTVLESAGPELLVYVDASAGGIDGQDRFPWVYLSLASGQRVDLNDVEALESTEWDLAFKRSTIRTNGGDSGPGLGGALRVGLDFAAVDATTLGNRTLPSESWFDADCNLSTDSATGSLITTFSDWSEYDQVNHTLAPAEAVYITAAADGSLYKLQILDYYSTAAGGHGPTSMAAHYKLHVAPLP